MKKKFFKLKKGIFSGNDRQNPNQGDNGAHFNNVDDSGKKDSKKRKKKEKKDKKKKKKMEKEERDQQRREVKRIKRDVDAEQYLKIFKKELFIGEEIVFTEVDVYYSHYSQWVYGLIVVTNFRLLFFKIEEDDDRDKGERDLIEEKFPIVVSAPLCTMYKIDKMGGRTTHNRAYGYQLVIWMKDLRILKFSLNTDHRTRGRLCKLLQSDIPLRFSFAYSYRREKDKAPEHKVVYDIYKEYCLRQKVVKLDPQKMNELYSKYPFYKTHKEDPPFMTWRITKVNEEWEFADTYPHLFCVPSQSTDDDIYNCSASRSKSRIPILCWADCNTGLSITRSSQPMVGFNLKGNSFDNDQKILMAIIMSNFYKKKLEIIDLRPRINAEANRFKGGGYEKGYNRCTLKMMGVENIHEMRKCYKSMMELCTTTCGTDKQFMNKVIDSNWYEHIKLCLRAPLFVVKLIEKEHRSCLVHCSDGWDRTAQCVCLAQIFLDPYFRTIEGFIVLIEKEWLVTGHNFQARIGTGMRNFFSENDKRSPIFFQFLECVRIVMVQHPTSFEYSEDLLVFLMDEIYSARFGNFLFNFQQERFQNDVYKETEDIWKFILSRDVRKKYLNPFYDPMGTKKTIVPDLRESHMPFWANYWLRFCHPIKPYIKDVTTNPQSGFHFYSSFEPPVKVVNKRGFEVMKEVSVLAEKNMMSNSRNEKTVNIFQHEIQKMSLELLKVKEENRKLKQLLDQHSVEYKELIKEDVEEKDKKVQEVGQGKKK